MSAAKSGWLIEKNYDKDGTYNPRALGVNLETKEPHWVPFTHEGAIRFARQVDAENTLAAFIAYDKEGESFEGVTVSEHGWG